MDTDSTFVVHHGHMIRSRIDPDCAKKETAAAQKRFSNTKSGRPSEEGIEPFDGWLHELFELESPVLVNGHWEYKGVGDSLGPFPTLGLAVQEAKRRIPPIWNEE